MTDLIIFFDIKYIEFKIEQSMIFIINKIINYYIFIARGLLFVTLYDVGRGLRLHHLFKVVHYLISVDFVVCSFVEVLFEFVQYFLDILSLFRVRQQKVV